MIAAWYLLLYACVLVFLVGCVVRAVRYARLPLHLRWELYPVPHEDPERVRHGGSYFEEPNWWAGAFRFHWFGELRAMLPEMLFLKALWEFNRPLWFRSFPFHFGLYLLIAAGVLVMITALLLAYFPQWLSQGLLAALHTSYAAAGVAGATLALVGAAALLHRRIQDPTLRIYTAPGDLANLAFFLVSLGLLLAAYLLRRPTAPGTLQLAVGWLTFDGGLRPAGLQIAALSCSALLAAYIPWTHMSHFIGKYFTYHAIRWDDLPTIRARELEKKIAQYLTYRPNWAAPHVMADGKRTWAEIALSNPARQEVKP